MVCPTTRQRSVPEDYRFCPTEQKLVGHYLRHKLMDPDDSICKTIPEIDVWEREPWEIPKLAAVAFPEMEEDDRECYFFRKCGYGARFNRKTRAGSWKVTGEDKVIKARDTENVIGKMKILVYHATCAPGRTIQRNCADEGLAERVLRGGTGPDWKWVIHEYHYVADDVKIPPGNGTYVVCKLIKKEADFSVLSKKHYLSNKDTIDSLIEHYLKKKG
ncbi:hypothetical protein QN277_009242 [Acacia crassicarpa]|uniref:NAC domain-containing protein n=1 Tax=Acacia crassicarpa TaxID=499986 RepID=A0AAE1ITE3_9FABA|nr:hypothetical protein QN277_009242 [Acacia crassicarpa]